MADLQEIVNFVNAELKRKQFKAKRFQKGTFIDTPVELITTKDGDDDQIKPCVVDNAGECSDVIIDDVNPLQVYHRITAYSVANIDEDDFGNPTKIDETYNVRTVVIGDRSRLLLTKEQIITGIAAGFPLEVPKVTRDALLSESVTIELGDVEVDAATVYQAEYQLTEVLLKPQNFMLAFSWTLVTRVNQACFVLCE